MEIQIVKLRDGAKVPERAHVGDAGWDLFIPSGCFDVKYPDGTVNRDMGCIQLVPNERVLIPLGFSVKLPCESHIEQLGWELQLRPRSGNAFKRGLTFANGVGTIDSTYRGEVGVILANIGRSAITICEGDKVGQAVLARYFIQDYKEVEQLPDSERGTGGFGSTGDS